MIVAIRSGGLLNDMTASCGIRVRAKVPLDEVARLLRSEAEEDVDAVDVT